MTTAPSSSVGAHGCALGYKDTQSGLPHYKPLRIITSSIVVANALRSRICSGDHQHERLEASNEFGIRTFLSAEWPEDMNRLFSSAIQQQAIVDNFDVGNAEWSDEEVLVGTDDQTGDEAVTSRRHGSLGVMSKHHREDEHDESPPESENDSVPEDGPSAEDGLPPEDGSQVMDGHLNPAADSIDPTAPIPEPTPTSASSMPRLLSARMKQRAEHVGERCQRRLKPSS